MRQTLSATVGRDRPGVRPARGRSSRSPSPASPWQASALRCGLPSRGPAASSFSKAAWSIASFSSGGQEASRSASAARCHSARYGGPGSFAAAYVSFMTRLVPFAFCFRLSAAIATNHRLRGSGRLIRTFAPAAFAGGDRLLLDRVQQLEPQPAPERRDPVGRALDAALPPHRRRCRSLRRSCRHGSSRREAHRVQPRPGLAGEFHLDRKSRRDPRRHQVRAVTGAFEAVAVLPVQLTRPLGTAEHLPLAKERPATNCQPRRRPRARRVMRPPGRRRRRRRESTARRASRTPFRVARNSEPSPHVIGHRSSQPSRSSRRA